jgi:Ser/Thr protein kinase RdoA (MazF antagonist)
MKNSIPKEVLGAYDIGKIDSVKAVTDGLVHKTFDLKTDTGRFILQNVHPVLATKGVAADFLAVTSFLHEKGFPTPEAILSKSGEILVHHDGNKWRMQTKLPGKTIHVLKDRAMAFEAGKIYARFHNVLNGMHYKFKAKKLLHETEKIYNKFLGEIRRPKHTSYLSDVEKEIDFIKEELPKYFLPNDLPMRVIHGDPKISNILFGGNGKAKAIIDLDTCNRRPLLVELGDAFRSWCGNAEDDPKNKFCLRMFQSSWGGYKEGIGDLMTDREKEYLPQAIGTITLELACRFLTDYFTDNYFGWDESNYESRRAQNLARCRGQIKEFKSYKEKFSKIKKIVA